MFCWAHYSDCETCLVNHLSAGEGVANEAGEGVANARRKQSNSATRVIGHGGLQQNNPRSRKAIWGCFC